MDRVREAKLLPPLLPAVTIERPRLDAVLREASTRRLTAIVAPAGFGKSTLLAMWADQHRCAWYSLTRDDAELDHLFEGLVAAVGFRVTGLSEAVRDAAPMAKGRGPDSGAEDGPRANTHAAVLAMVLEQRLASDLILVIDDLHLLHPGSASARFIEALCRQAPIRLHLVALSRHELPFPTARLRAQGQAIEVSGAMMAFAAEESLALTTGIVGTDRDHAATRLHESTLGWPAAVRLGAEAMRERAQVPTLPDPTEHAPDTMIDLLAGEVFDSADPALAGLLRVVAPLGGFNAPLGEALGIADADVWIHDLERRGLVQSHGTGGDGWYTLHPIVRHYAERRLPVDEAAHRQIQLRASAWLAEAGQPREALRCLRAAGDPTALATGLRDHGPDMVLTGGADELLDHVDALPADHRDAAIHQLEGEARHAVGDWDGALACFGRLGDADEFPPSAAWRTGLIHHQRGDLDAALACYEQGLLSAGDPVDRALVLAWTAAARWLRGDLESCRKLAEEAQLLADEHGDHRALAAAHTALAMVAALDGDRRGNDAHYLRALYHAEQAGDVLQLIRIHSNRGSRSLEEGTYQEALQELDAAIDMADLAGFALLRSLALTNRGQVLYRLGRLDEALRDLEAARAHYATAGAHMLAYPLGHIGDVHAARGEQTAARAAYEEAIRLSESVGDLQGLVPALTGLALAVLDTDPEEAGRLANRAAEAGPALGHARSILAQAWVALRTGDLDTARLRADDAAAVARAQRDRASLAESVEVRARSERDVKLSVHGLAEAAALWRQLGQPIDAARVDLALADRSPEPDRTERRRAAQADLRACGARIVEGRDEVLTGDEQRIGVTALGGFRIQLGETSIDSTAWGSRKPRDLLKILVARRSGPVRREQLIDILWPDDDVDRASRKLSVALSTLRGIVDPDRTHDSDHYVAADRDGVWLVAEHWDIDIEHFVADATEGLRRHQSGDPEGLRMLDRAESLFRGEPFDEDVYEDWARPIRDEVRAVYTGAARTLAEAAISAGDHDRAIRLLLRLLERDAYDEPAHLGLVRSLQSDGRHGEARRVYRTYCERMEEVGVEPSPFPVIDRHRAPS